MRSLSKHVDDIVSDNRIINTDIIGFTEIIKTDIIGFAETQILPSDSTCQITETLNFLILILITMKINF